MAPPESTAPRRELKLASLRLLSRRYPDIDSALAEIACLQASLTLPRGTVHVISDVHGDNAKLRHVINNASGTLRPLVEKTLGGQLSAAEIQDFLALIFYPAETFERLEPTLPDVAARRVFCQKTLRNLFAVIRQLTQQTTWPRVQQVLPEQYREVFLELLFERPATWGDEYLKALLDTLARQGRVLHLLRLTVRLLRDLAIDELVMGGDFWDRGPRGDRVMDYLMRQPNVAITWGNHDAAWLGACLGHDVLVAHVLRISMRYRRLSQLEEGYGITMQPIEQLARTVYGKDPAECYPCKGTGLRPAIQMARMHKAAAIMQFKLEGQLAERNPEFSLENRRLLHRIDPKAGTIQIDGKPYKLKDTNFPTIDPAHPYDLSAEEEACLRRTKQSFLTSKKLWEHMQYMVRRGCMYLNRDDHLIFHGCVPVDEKGEFLPLKVDGEDVRGKEMFDALDRVVVRSLDRKEKDLDMLWYLWCGARSPLFGKDRITTLENDLVAEPETHVETKNPYFKLIHEVPFCEKILKEFGVDPGRGLIVNGHVPVKIEKGENPLKRSGKAITIDGAFSSAYGDHGYTLVLEPERTFLAEHHHFESVQAAVRDGVDIIPKITEIRKWSPPRRQADTERGAEIRAEIALLQQLVDAYRANQLTQG